MNCVGGEAQDRASATVLPIACIPAAVGCSGTMRLAGDDSRVVSSGRVRADVMSGSGFGDVDVLDAVTGRSCCHDRVAVVDHTLEIVGVARPERLSAGAAATTDVCSVSDHDDARRRCSILRDFDHRTPTCGRIFDHLSLLIDATGGELVTAGRSGGFGEWIDATQNCREQRDVVGTDGDGDEVGIRPQCCCLR